MATAEPTYVSPSLRLVAQGSIVKQGAEARVYTLPCLISTPSIYPPPSTPSTPSIPSSSSTSSTSSSVILKHRFPKTYRHPSLDASLTRTRLQFEARALARCARGGVVVPRLAWVDEVAGVLGMEKVEGWSVREVLGGGAEGEVEVEEGEEVEMDSEAGMGGNGDKGGSGAGQASVSSEASKAAWDDVASGSEGMEALKHLGVTPEHLMASIGRALAKMHAITIIHGDLTTSNMMIRLTPGLKEAYEVVLIDFGLSSVGSMPENYAVDLYVLERAFASTHPSSEGLYAGVLEAYAIGLGEKKWKPIEIKLKEVRLRGRKRDMTG